MASNSSIIVVDANRPEFKKPSKDHFAVDVDTCKVLQNISIDSNNAAFKNIIDISSNAQEQLGGFFLTGVNVNNLK